MFRDVHPIALGVFDPALGNGTIDICIGGGPDKLLDRFHAGHDKPKVMNAPRKIRVLIRATSTKPSDR